MPPKKKKGDDEDLGAMRAARFGRVKNTLSMGFGTSVVSLGDRIYALYTSLPAHVPLILL